MTKVKNPTLKEVSAIFQEFLSGRTFAEAEVILGAFATKEDAERRTLANLKVELTGRTDKFEAASKVGNQIGNQQKVSYVEADIVATQARIDAIVAKRDTFIAAFTADPYATLADASLASVRLDK